MVTGYEFVIDTDEDPEATPLAATKIKVGGVNGTDDAKNASNPLDISDFKLGTNEIIIEDKDASNADAHKFMMHILKSVTSTKPADMV